MRLFCFGWKIMKKIVLMLISAFLLSACASDLVKRPSISVKNAEVSKVSFRESTAVFTVQVDNPNSFPIYISGVDYGLRLNGRSVADGSYNSSTKISAGQSKKLEMPVKLRLADLFSMIPTFLRERRVQYSLDGRVKTPFIHLPFHRDGGVGVDN
jgi:LEA14-like dessication related protein